MISVIQMDCELQVPKSKEGQGKVPKMLTLGLKYTQTIIIKQKVCVYFNAFIKLSHFNL